jgi:hypothetical protein
MIVYITIVVLPVKAIQDISEVQIANAKKPRCHSEVEYANTPGVGG